MKIYLLTHQRELNRKTNTGSLALESSDGLVERIMWERVNPNKNLVELIQSHAAVLLYPSSDSCPVNIEKFDHIIILDATWQEAQKMYNQSDYLKPLEKFTLSNSQPSNYQLRRNQPQGGLCTIECVIEVLLLKGHDQMAHNLKNSFINFNNKAIELL